MIGTGDFLKSKARRASHARRLRDIVSWLQGIVDPETLQKYIGVNNSEMGKRLGEVHPNGHGGRAFHRSTVSHYNKGDYAMTHDTELAYQRVLQNEIAKETDGRLAVSLKVLKHQWRVVPRLVCKRCSNPFDPQRLDQTLCPKCKKGKAK